MITTSDFSDIFPEKLEYLNSIFKSYGKRTSFCGSIVTVQCYDDVFAIKKLVSSAGLGKILFIDGGGVQNFSLLDEILCEEASKNGWEGIILNGFLRNSRKINQLDIGVKALGENIRLTRNKGFGETNVQVEFAGAKIKNGDISVVDSDGVVVFRKEIINQIKPKF